MPTEPSIKQTAPRYEAVVTHEGTTVKGTIGAAGARSVVQLQRGQGRSILRVEIEHWDAFEELVVEIGEALRTKAQVENPSLDPRLQVPVSPEAAPIPDRQISA